MTGQLRLEDSNLPDFLRDLGFLGHDESVSIEKAGDGNINWVRRARLADGRSWIVKQARPALERFPEYRVDTRRIVYEARWTELARAHDDEHICPEILHFSESERVLILEDLGSAERLDTRLARGGFDAGPTGASLARLLGRVHAATADADLTGRFDNDEMRRLHGDHIFLLPFGDEPFPLDPEVEARSRALREPGFRAIAAAAYRRYLEPRGALVHGDVQAGNVLLPPTGPKLIDAEIAHIGDPAFDVGTLIAHLLLPAVAARRANAAVPAVQATWNAYVETAGPAHPRFSDVARYAGLEILRRTVGAARVPVLESPEASRAALDYGELWTRTPPDEPAGLA
jgi:5-methylthioribose kinase